MGVTDGTARRGEGQGAPFAGEAIGAGMHPALLGALACPKCHGQLVIADSIRCNSCGSQYPASSGVPDFRVDRSAAEQGSELEDWSHHWASENQELVSQRFFSFYRKAVFARTVAHFIEKYFPRHGLLVEAGCGTSESSIRIAKHGGGRVLVAVDIVPSVVARAHPVMDERLCGDVFRLPFRDQSIDGIWNVGVMEHFTHDRIDDMMREFRRVLRPAAPLLLLWPGTTSPPQRILRVLEKVIHLRGNDPGFRFHPPEISQLHSAREGRDVLARNGFAELEIDGGPRSLFAFKTLVARRP